MVFQTFVVRRVVRIFFYLLCPHGLCLVASPKRMVQVVLKCRFQFVDEGGKRWATVDQIVDGKPECVAGVIVNNVFKLPTKRIYERVDTDAVTADLNAD